MYVSQHPDQPPEKKVCAVNNERVGSCIFRMLFHSAINVKATEMTLWILSLKTFSLALGCSEKNASKSKWL